MAESPFQIRSFTAGDGYEWKYRHFQPAGTPKARVVGIHGIQSHGGWYTYSCQRLCQAGYEVFFLDRRGAGLNERERGDVPYWRRLVDDIAEFLRHLRQTARLPTYLIAISWGGKIGTALQRRHPGVVQGLALLCPGFFPRLRTAWLKRLVILFCCKAFPGAMFQIPLSDPDLFTASPHWQKFIAEDPCMLRRATARMAYENGRLDGYLRLWPPQITIPVLLMLAEKDRIIDNAATRHYVEQIALGPRDIIVYPGAHHTLEFEPDPEVFIRDLTAWLERCLAAERSNAPLGSAR
ncbi:MAG: lysophospholipase [Gemmataceae bacterium]|nr:lysophospholipase [Gemmataceae bacterium]MDW8266795.1 alpha/beta fold hydrolase [Gemmataceae bacterium]